jgi:hypothetical protein
MKAGTDMTKTDVSLSNSLTDLAARINEAHHRAMHHVGEALGQAIACGQMLLEATFGGAKESEKRPPRPLGR